MYTNLEGPGENKCVVKVECRVLPPVITLSSPSLPPPIIIVALSPGSIVPVKEQELRNSRVVLINSH